MLQNIVQNQELRNTKLRNIIATPEHWLNNGIPTKQHQSKELRDIEHRRDSGTLVEHWNTSGTTEHWPNSRDTTE